MIPQLSIDHMAALVVAAIGTFTDLKARKIPNALTFSASILAILMHGFQSGITGALAAIVGWLAGVAIIVIPFIFFSKKMGFGDAKLMGALGAFLGLPLILIVYFYSCLFLGLSAAAYAIKALPWTKLFALLASPSHTNILNKSDLDNVRHILKSTIPLAPAIFAGSICGILFEKETLQFFGFM